MSKQMQRAQDVVTFLNDDCADLHAMDLLDALASLGLHLARGNRATKRAYLDEVHRFAEDDE